jgi:hypothetical protein
LSSSTPNLQLPTPKERFPALTLWELGIGSWELLDTSDLWG